MSRRIKHSRVGKIQREQLAKWNTKCNSLENELWANMNGDESEVVKLRKFGFTYSCKEAEYIGIKKRGLPFEVMCAMRRGILYMQVLHDIDKVKKEGESFAGLNLFTDEQLDYQIKRVYTSHDEQGE